MRWPHAALVADHARRLNGRGWRPHDLMLWLLGVPLAVLLGLQAFLLTFVPYIGRQLYLEETLHEPRDGDRPGTRGDNRAA